MSAARRTLRDLETWLWTGPLGHLVGGAADFATALAHYGAARLSRRGLAGAPRRGSERR